MFESEAVVRDAISYYSIRHEDTVDALQRASEHAHLSLFYLSILRERNDRPALRRFLKHGMHGISA